MSLIKTIKRPFRLMRLARLRSEHKLRVKKKRIPYPTCYNCGQELHGTYCHNCGQRARDISPNLGSFVSQYFENSFQWDGKFFLTIRTLFTHPGRLSVSWADGHVARYVFPFKLYMFVMVIFGLISVTLLNRNSESLGKKSYTTAVADFAISQKIEQSKTLDSTSYARVNDLLSSKVQVVEPQTQVIFSSTINMLSRLPIIFMFAMPFFAVITGWFFRRRYKKFIPHLVFAIHIHTLFFIVASVDVILRNIYNIPVSTVWITVIGCLVYTVFAAHVFFGDGWTRSSVKVFTSMIIYCIFCIIVFLIGFLANLYYDSLISGTSVTDIFK